MRPIERHLALILIALGLGGCANLPQGPGSGAAPPAEAAGMDEAQQHQAAAPEASEPAPEPEPEPITQDLLYNLLAGEIAGQRGHYLSATEFYTQAAEESRDPRVAERALRIALFAQDQDNARRAAARWVDLDPQDEEARRTLVSLLVSGDQPEAALDELRRLVQAAGGGDEAFHAVTGVLGREEDRGRALDLMAQLAAEYPDNPEAVLAYARMAIHAGQYDLALSQTEKALAMRSPWPEAEMLKAHAQLQLGQTEQALATMKVAAQGHPEDGSVRINYARMLLESGDKDAAREQFEKALEQDPENGDVLLSLALIDLEAERLDDSRDYFEKLVETDQHTRAARYYLGRIAEAQGDKAEALNRYEQVGGGDYWLDAQLRIARLLADSGDLDTALQRLRAIRVRNPHAESVVTQVEGELLAREGRLKEAMALYDDALAKQPEDTDLLYARALLAERMDRLDIAERDFRRIIAAEPDNAHALNALGYTLADRTSRLKEALGYIERAYKLAPDEPAIVDSMGWVQYRLGDLSKAREYLQRAFEMSQDAEIGAHLGEVLWESGDQDKAREVWDKAREDDADNHVLRETLKRYQP